MPYYLFTYLTSLSYEHCFILQNNWQY
jgi:hypothetical protein